MSGLNILVPLAGEGRSFREHRSVFPKPLVEIGGKPMIQVVVENLAALMPARFIFVINRDDAERFALAEVLRLVAENCEVIVAPGPTRGAACTAMLAIRHIDNDDPLVIANGDQFLNCDLSEFLADAYLRELDGSMITFRSVHPKWSFARLDDDGFVVETSEKRPISNNATAGVYYFRCGRGFVRVCQSMIRKDARVMDQFFICPAYNEMILEGARIRTYAVPDDVMFPLTTPEEVKIFAASQGGRHAEHRDSRSRRRLTLYPRRAQTAEALY
ncbi:MAG TPA: glycosyltransferase family 2 protein [Acidobacteriota bacterium]|nr:glycosyltransferase family 2 protein [Acidobacteriota bacterium]